MSGDKLAARAARPEVSTAEVRKKLRRLTAPESLAPWQFVFPESQLQDMLFRG
jgi:hypothetical protein